MTDTQVTLASKPRQREAYERIVDEMAALDESELAPINLDIMAAVSTAMGSLGEIKTLRARVESELPKFDLRQIDQLETYALATMHAQSQFAAASTPPERIPQMVEEAAKMRDMFVADVTSLGKRGLVNANKLTELKGTNGFRNTASDLLMLASMLRANWAKIAGKAPISEADLDHAEILGEQIVTAVGFREQGPNVPAEVVTTRQRAFTLFMRAYDQIRRAFAYLRWTEDDVDRFAPTFYASRGVRRPTTDTSKVDAVATQTTGAEGTGATATPATAVATAATGVAPAGVGLPGASPFLK